MSFDHRPPTESGFPVLDALPNGRLAHLSELARTIRMLDEGFYAQISPTPTPGAQVALRVWHDGGGEEFVHCDFVRRGWAFFAASDGKRLGGAEELAASASRVCAVVRARNG